MRLSLISNEGRYDQKRLNGWWFKIGWAREFEATQASIDTCANINCISQKHIGELGIAYHDENNSIKTLDATYSTIGKVNLHIGFNDGEKHKSTPSEFIVAGPDWPDYFPDLVLGMPWFQENGATLDICNSKLLLDNNFATLFKEVKWE